LPDDRKEAKRVTFQASQMEIIEGRLYHHGGAKEGPSSRHPDPSSVPEGSRRSLRAHHDELLGGHLGEKRTLDRIRQLYWWPPCNLCDSMGQAMPAAVRRERLLEPSQLGLLHPIPQRRRPFQTCRSGHHRSTEDDYSGEQVLGCVCGLVYSNGQSVFAATRSQGTNPLPDSMLKNRSAAMVHLSRSCRTKEDILSKLIKEIKRIVADQKVEYTAYHPQTDGSGWKRFNGLWKSTVRCTTADNQKAGTSSCPTSCLPTNVSAASRPRRAHSSYSMEETLTSCGRGLGRPSEAMWT